MEVFQKYMMKAKEYPVVISVVCILILLLIWKIPYLGRESNSVNEVEQIIDGEIVEEVKMVLVDVKGEVRTPGVYEIESDKRVHDAIALAGGMKDTGDSNSLNLAQKVHDEMLIEVLHKTKLKTNGNHYSDGKVNINLASVEELQKITGVGPKKAEAIVKYREENGSFLSIEDLDKVSGFGLKTIEKIKEEILW